MRTQEGKQNIATGIRQNINQVAAKSTIAVLNRNENKYYKRD